MTFTIRCTDRENLMRNAFAFPMVLGLIAKNMTFQRAINEEDWASDDYTTSHFTSQHSFVAQLWYRNLHRPCQFRRFAFYSSFRIHAATLQCSLLGESNVANAIRCPLSAKSKERLDDSKNQVEFEVDLNAVSYTHLTLPTKRIV